MLLYSDNWIPEEPPIIRNHAIKMFNLGGEALGARVSEVGKKINVFVGSKNIAIN